jgi:hypothetical protein
MIWELRISGASTPSSLVSVHSHWHGWQRSTTHSVGSNFKQGGARIPRGSIDRTAAWHAIYWASTALVH